MMILKSSQITLFSATFSFNLWKFKLSAKRIKQFYIDCKDESRKFENFISIFYCKFFAENPNKIMDDRFGKTGL
ncbi:hypothetical protein H8356DRAFT_1364386 [Neocallimastix lanati (nom. inval.)]|nr:hypothetical protein H8356DRAFT_1364386 [Neocallimastix sp. JGI-2020a]